MVLAAVLTTAVFNTVLLEIVGLVAARIPLPRFVKIWFPPLLAQAILWLCTAQSWVVGAPEAKDGVVVDFSG